VRFTDRIRRFDLSETEVRRAGSINVMASLATLTEVSRVLRYSLARWTDHDAPRLGAAIAFYTLLSLAPLLAICTAMVSVAFGSKMADSEITDVVRLWIGDGAARMVSDLIEGIHRPSGMFSGGLTVLVFFLGASSVFG